MKKQQTITRVTIFNRYLIILGTVEMVSNSFNHQDIGVTLYDERFEVLAILDGEAPDFDITEDFTAGQICEICEHARKNHDLVSKSNIVLSQFSSN